MLEEIVRRINIKQRMYTQHTTQTHFFLLFKLDLSIAVSSIAVGYYVETVGS